MPLTELVLLAIAGVLFGFVLAVGSYLLYSLALDLTDPSRLATLPVAPQRVQLSVDELVEAVEAQLEARDAAYVADGSLELWVTRSACTWYCTLGGRSTVHADYEDLIGVLRMRLVMARGSQLAPGGAR